MAMQMDRRTFLKTTAAAAVAVSLSGMLAGCSESEESGVELYGYTVDVDMKKAQKFWGGSAGPDTSNDTGYLYTTVKLKAGNGVNVNTSMGIFSAKTSDGAELTLENKYSPVVLVKGVAVPVEVRFSTKEKKVYDALASGAVTLLLDVNLTGGSEAVQYTLDFATGAAAGKVVRVAND